MLRLTLLAPRLASQLLVAPYLGVLSGIPLLFGTGTVLLKLHIRGEPVAWARAGRGGKLTFTPARQKEAMRAIQWHAGQAMGDKPPFQCALHVDLVFTYAWPKSTSKRRKQLSPVGKMSRPDLDNLTKLVCDALNMIVWEDDSQITFLTAAKQYSDVPGVELSVRREGDGMCLECGGTRAIAGS